MDKSSNIVRNKYSTMKKTIYFFLISCFILTGLYAQNRQQVNVNKPGTLISHFTEEEAKSIEELTLTGKINAVDFRYLRDDFSSLKILDISNADIRMYTGGKGTHPDNFYLYPANCIPAYAFCKLENGVYNGNESLEKIILSEKIKNIEDAAFKNCNNLRVCQIRRKTAPNLLPDALNDSITSIFVPVGCADTYKTKRGWASFAILEGDPVEANFQIGKLEKLEEKLKAAGFDPGKVNFLKVEGKLDENDLKMIGDKMTNLVGVDISKTNARKLPDYTFTQKKNLLYIDLPNDLTDIGERVFSNCIRLSGELVLPPEVQTIGYGAFMGCDKLKSVVVTGDKKLSVGEKLFGDRKDIELRYK